MIPLHRVGQVRRYPAPEAIHRLRAVGDLNLAVKVRKVDGFDVQLFDMCSTFMNFSDSL